MPVNNLKACDTTEKLYIYLIASKVAISADFEGRRVKLKNEGTGVDNVSIKNLVEQLKTAIEHDKQAQVEINPEHIRKILKKIDKFNNQANLAKADQSPFIKLVIFIRSLFGNIGFDRDTKLTAIREEFSKDFKKASINVKHASPQQLAKTLMSHLGSNKEQLQKIGKLLDDRPTEDGKPEISDVFSADSKLEGAKDAETNRNIEAILEHIIILGEPAIEEFLKEIKVQDKDIFKIYALLMIARLPSLNIKVINEDPSLKQIQNKKMQVKDLEDFKKTTTQFIKDKKIESIRPKNQEELELAVRLMINDRKIEDLSPEQIEELATKCVEIYLPLKDHVRQTITNVEEVLNLIDDPLQLINELKAKGLIDENGVANEIEIKNEINNRVMKNLNPDLDLDKSTQEILHKLFQKFNNSQTIELLKAIEKQDEYLYKYIGIVLTGKSLVHITNDPFFEKIKKYGIALQS